MEEKGDCPFLEGATKDAATEAERHSDVGRGGSRQAGLWAKGTPWGPSKALQVQHCGVRNNLPPLESAKAVHGTFITIIIIWFA